MWLLTQREEHQGDMRWLHRPLHHPHQLLGEPRHVYLTVQNVTKGREHTGGIEPASKEAPIYAALYAPTERLKYCRDAERGDDDRERAILLAGERPRQPAQKEHASGVQRNKHAGQDAVHQ